MLRWRPALLLILAGLLPASQPPLRLFTTQDGLVRNWVTRIRRDSRGFLWFCTVEGLSIFDGSRFRNFTTRDGLPSRAINDVLETSDGEYWIATRAGVSRFHLLPRDAKGPFENFRLDAAEDANYVTMLFEDTARTIWCATEGGLYRLHRSPSGIRFEPVRLRPGRQPVIAALLEDAEQRLWIVGEGAYVLPRNGAAARITDPAVATGLNAILADDKGRIWMGGDNGLSALDSSLKVVANYRSVDGEPLGVLAMHHDAAGEIWVAAHMLVRFRPDAEPAARFRVYRTSRLLHGEYIGALATDMGGNLWLAISNLGAARLSREPSELFSVDDGLSSRNIHGLTEGRKGTLYAIAGEGHTLNEFTGDAFQPQPAKMPPGVTYMGWGEGQIVLQDRTGEWWFASGSGVLRYPATDDTRALRTTIPHLYTVRDGLPTSTILRLFEDSHGDIWAGTSDGAACWSRASGTWRQYHAPVTPGAELTGAVHAIAEDHNGAVWLGFASPCVMRIRDGQAAIIRDGLAGFVNALLTDHSGRVWIGTSQAGVAVVDDPASATPRIRSYTMDRGLASNQVFSMVEDRWGRIYIAGGRGVDRLTPATGAVRHYTEDNGLPAGETQRLYRDRNGYIWFASNFGLARHLPEPDQTSVAPQPRLRGLAVNGIPRLLSVLGESEMGNLELPAGQDNLQIEYRALHFAAGERLRYQYRLLGASDRWSPPQDLQTVQYAKLGPGRYRFEIRSMSEDGATSRPATLEFRLLPPLWQQWWFITAELLALAAAAYGLHRYRLRHMLALERVRTRLATDLHDDLGAGLAEIAILTEVAKRKPQADAGALLDHVARRARGLRAALGDIVWNVDPRRDCLSDLVDRMRETALPLLQSDGRSVEFNAPVHEELQRIDLTPDMRRHLLLFFKEATTNVARHADATRIEIRLNLANRRLRMNVKDNGRGFDPQSGSSGRGLASMRHRAAEMKGDFQVDSQPGRGTSVELGVTL
jgi:ligand-binding sensor domain-containing protein/two-component sensor histidine kinase